MQITTREQLRALYGEPADLTKSKVRDHLTQSAQDFIRKSPLLFLATGAEVSPKGDPPGFVRIEDERTLLIPDRPGNKLLFGYETILQHPEVGLIFLVPGTTETLRVSGTATLWQDDILQQELAERGKPALLILKVTVTECFFHCGKALIRSHLWQSDQWGEPYKMNWAHELNNAQITEAAVAREYSQEL